MFDQLKSLFSTESSGNDLPELNMDLAAAALMVHVITADGIVTPEEEAKLAFILRQHYAVSQQETETLAAAARKAQTEATDFCSFAHILKRELSEEKRLELTEDLWEMVFADGKLHEFEDNIVWRIADLIGVSPQEQMRLKQRVLVRRS